MIDFSFVSATLYHTRDFNFQVRKLIGGVRQLMLDLYGGVIDENDIAVRMDQLAPNIASTPVWYCGRSLGTLTWRYDIRYERWFLCDASELENMFTEFKRVLEHFNTEFYERALLHILGDNYTKLEE